MPPTFQPWARAYSEAAEIPLASWVMTDVHFGASHAKSTSVVVLVNQTIFRTADRRRRNQTLQGPKRVQLHHNQRIECMAFRRDSLFAPSRRASPTDRRRPRSCIAFDRSGPPRIGSATCPRYISLIPCLNIDPRSRRACARVLADAIRPALDARPFCRSTTRSLPG